MDNKLFHLPTLLTHFHFDPWMQQTFEGQRHNDKRSRSEHSLRNGKSWVKRRQPMVLKAWDKGSQPLMKCRNCRVCSELYNYVTGGDREMSILFVSGSHNKVTSGFSLVSISSYYKTKLWGEKHLPASFIICGELNSYTWIANAEHNCLYLGSKNENFLNSRRHQKSSCLNFQHFKSTMSWMTESIHRQHHCFGSRYTQVHFDSDFTCFGWLKLK